MYTEVALERDEIMDELLTTLATLAAQSSVAKELFLHKASGTSLMERLLTLASK